MKNISPLWGGFLSQWVLLITFMIFVENFALNTALYLKFPFNFYNAFTVVALACAFCYYSHYLLVNNEPHK